MRTFSALLLACSTSLVLGFGVDLISFEKEENYLKKMLEYAVNSTATTKEEVGGGAVGIALLLVLAKKKFGGNDPTYVPANDYVPPADPNPLPANEEATLEKLEEGFTNKFTSKTDKVLATRAYRLVQRGESNMYIDQDAFNKEYKEIFLQQDKYENYKGEMAAKIDNVVSEPVPEKYYWDADPATLRKVNTFAEIQDQLLKPTEKEFINNVAEEDYSRSKMGGKLTALDAADAKAQKASEEALDLTDSLSESNVQLDSQSEASVQEFMQNYDFGADDSFFDSLSAEGEKLSNNGQSISELSGEDMDIAVESLQKTALKQRLLDILTKKLGVASSEVKPLVDQYSEGKSITDLKKLEEDPSELELGFEKSLEKDAQSSAGAGGDSSSSGGELPGNNNIGEDGEDGGDGVAGDIVETLEDAADT